MNCAEFSKGLDDLLDGELSPDRQAAMQAHEQSCDACRRRVEAARHIQQALRDMPVPAPSAGFADRALRAAVEQNTAHHHRRGFVVGFGSALVAGFALWLVVGLLPMRPGPAPEEGAVSEVSIALNEPHEVTLAFHAVRALEGAKISIQLPANVALVGYPGRRTLEWRTNLAEGNNILRLPVVATGMDGGQLVAHLEYGNKVRTLKIKLKAVKPNLSERSAFGRGVAA
jgi:anti-sigma factor RsiW